jgi:hypothetical protein
MRKAPKGAFFVGSCLVRGIPCGLDIPEFQLGLVVFHQAVELRLM